LAEEFLRCGARVAISARDAKELAAARLQLERSSPSNIAVMQVVCDVTDPSSVQDAVEQVHDTSGSIDVLVNNAGIMAVAPLLNQPPRRFQEAMDTNFFGALNSCFCVLAAMLGRGEGTIINVASIGGLVAVPHMLPYTASKFALVGFSRRLHNEVKLKGVNVLTVCPWLMRTGSHTHAKVGGKANYEYAWFATSATLPLLSVPARTAARQILQAAANGKSELLISPLAVIAATVANNAPASTAAVLSLVNRALPSERASAGDGQTEGRDVEGPTSALPDALGRSAEVEWNQ
jgi:short-subunit dehydrogenase